VLKPQPKLMRNGGWYRPFPHAHPRDWQYALGDRIYGYLTVPYAPGDRLWVRERARCVAVRDGEIKVRYEADGHEPDFWLPFPDRLNFTPAVGKCLSMGCYREASRMTLPNVTTVRVQRVQEITAEDAVAEGIGAVPEAFHDDGPCPVSDPDCLGGEGECHDACRPVDARTAFSRLWDGLNAKRGFGWKKNPWVVALGFTVARGNIDQLQ
jgi:hypothetical protein